MPVFADKGLDFWTTLKNKMCVMLVDFIDEQTLFALRSSFLIDFYVCMSKHKLRQCSYY